MIEFFPTSTTFVRIGGLHIQWYAILILTGALITLYFSKKDLKVTRYIDVNGFMDDLFIYTLWVGIIGARLWFCLFFNPSYYLAHPAEIIAIWNGGLAIHGGLVFGAAFAAWYCHKHNVSFLKTADNILPHVLLAQALGRWGNFVNQECHGPEVPESFYDGILSFLKQGMYIDGHYYMPMFFFESVACVAGWFLIRYLFKRYSARKRGDMVWAYLMWYGIVRAFIEQYRTDSLMIGPFKTAVLTSFAFVAVGLAGYFGLFDKLFVKKRKPTVLFDLDGTLVDTSASIIEGYRYLFEKYDDVKNFTKERQVEILGPGLRELFPVYFPGQDVEKLVDEYHAVSVPAGDRMNVLNPHAKEVLETLRAEGYHVGIVSTKMHETVAHNLEQVGASDLIEDIVGVDEVGKLKPDPEGLRTIIKRNRWNADDVLYIGDSAADVAAGLNYGAYSIAYDINPDKSEALNSAGASRVIHDLAEVSDILKEDRCFTYDGK